MTSNATVTLDQQELRTVIAALWDKVIESEGYRNRNQTTKEPTAQDTCCDAHLNRWKRDREIYVSLQQRVKDERALIKKLEALEEETP